MSIRHILTLTAATLLAAPTMQAQAPATPAAVPPTGAPTTSTPVAPATPAAKPKPLSMQETKAVSDILESLQFHIYFSERAKWNKDDKDLSEFGKKSYDDLAAQFTPLVNYAMAHGVDHKNIPSEVKKKDKEDIGKINKEKGDKYKVAYFELYSKEGKRNVRQAETAIKAISDAELKTLATKAVSSISTQTDTAEAKAKELKGKK